MKNATETLALTAMDDGSQPWLGALAEDVEVWWNDPDQAASGHYQVASIRGGAVADGDTVVVLRTLDGGSLEVLASELAPARRHQVLELMPDVLAIDRAAQSANFGMLRLTVDVAYSRNGVPLEVLKEHIENMVVSAVGNGLLTGNTEAEVDEYSINVVEIVSPMTEDEIAERLLVRMQSGNLALEELPLRLARYGLMDPVAFLSEMRERAELSATQVAGEEMKATALA